MLVGLTFAILAALGSGIGSAVEGFGVRRARARGDRPGDMAPLLREPIYFVGLTVDLLGFVFTVLALQLLPLFLVQAVVASSVGVTAIIVALSGRSIGRAAWLCVAASLVGLVLLAMSSEPHDGTSLPTAWDWVVLALALPIAGIGYLGSRIRGRWASPVLALGAGLAFSCVAIAARSLDVPDPAWQIMLEPTLWTIVISGLLGTVLFAMGIQRGRVTEIAAIAFTTETVLPSIVGIAFMGDSVRSGFALVATAGFLVAVSGAIALARFTEPLPASAPAPPLRADPASA